MTNNTRAFPNALFDYLDRHTLIEVKGGTSRPDFLKIWMVKVENRLFARSWNKSGRSWFTEFEKLGMGQVKFGEQILLVKGRKVDPRDPVQPEINRAYLQKYTQKENLSYAEGITQPEYADFTMEFLPELE